MKRPLVECDVLIEALSDLRIARGEFLIGYFTDEKRQKLAVVGVFNQRPALEAPKAIPLALPAPPTKISRVKKPTISRVKKRPQQVGKKSQISKISRRIKKKLTQPKIHGNKPRRGTATSINWPAALGLKVLGNSTSNSVRQRIFDGNGEWVSIAEISKAAGSSAANIYHAARAPLKSNYFARGHVGRAAAFRVTPRGVTYLSKFSRAGPAPSPEHQQPEQHIQDTESATGQPNPQLLVQP